jgi:hypothetical protein
VVVEDPRLGFMQPFSIGPLFISVKARQGFVCDWLRLPLGGSDEVLGGFRIRPLVSKQPIAKPI